MVQNIYFLCFNIAGAEVRIDSLTVANQSWQFLEVNPADEAIPAKYNLVSWLTDV